VSDQGERKVSEMRKRKEGGEMILKHRIEFVDGDIDTDKQKLSCGANRKYGQVSLCFDCGMSVGFASIKLHSSDTAKDADAVFDDARKLGEEIARRWNIVMAMPARMEAYSIIAHGTAGADVCIEDIDMMLDKLGFKDNPDCDCESCKDCKAKGF